MTTDALLPAADALPLPAAPWLLHFLLILTFTLHLLAMNGLLGGIILAVYHRLRSRSSDDQHSLAAAKIVSLLPVLVAGTVTLGVAPLLFLQTLFGQFFFTSSVIMGWTWFAVVVLVILAYYGTYQQSFAGERFRARRTPLLALTALLFALIAFIYSNNTTLMLSPNSWAGIYFANPGGGNWNLQEPMLAPRYLHMLLGAVAVAGLMLAWWGLAIRSDEPELGRFMHRHGLTVFTWLTAANIAIGIWFFLALDRPVRKLMMGGSGSATALFAVGFVLAVILLGLTARAKISATRSSLSLATLVGLLTLVSMVLLRDQVRMGYLSGLYDPGSFPVRAQTVNFILFALLLAAGLFTVVWMLKRLLKTAL